MSELVWDIKNGELESVKNEIENKVIITIDELLISNFIFRYFVMKDILSLLLFHYTDFAIFFINLRQNSNRFFAFFRIQIAFWLKMTDFLVIK